MFESRNTLKPIPLTEDWLLKFAFVLLSETSVSVFYGYKNYQFEVMKNGSTIVAIIGNLSTENSFLFEHFYGLT